MHQINVNALWSKARTSWTKHFQTTKLTRCKDVKLIWEYRCHRKLSLTSILYVEPTKRVGQGLNFTNKKVLPCVLHSRSRHSHSKVNDLPASGKAGFSLGWWAGVPTVPTRSPVLNCRDTLTRRSMIFRQAVKNWILFRLMRVPTVPIGNYRAQCYTPETLTGRLMICPQSEKMDSLSVDEGPNRNKKVSPPIATLRLSLKVDDLPASKL